MPHFAPQTRLFHTAERRLRLMIKRINQHTAALNLPRQRLRTTAVVAHRQSFRGAARELCMSATAVSRAVAGLEAWLNVRIFNRSTRTVALTDAGRRYIARIAPALAEIQRGSSVGSARWMRWSNG